MQAAVIDNSTNINSLNTTAVGLSNQNVSQKVKNSSSFSTKSTTSISPAHQLFEQAAESNRIRTFLSKLTNSRDVINKWTSPVKFTRTTNQFITTSSLEVSDVIQTENSFSDKSTTVLTFSTDSVSLSSPGNNITCITIIVLLTFQSQMFNCLCKDCTKGLVQLSSQTSKQVHKVKNIIAHVVLRSHFIQAKFCAALPYSLPLVHIKDLQFLQERKLANFFSQVCLYRHRNLKSCYPGLNLNSCQCQMCVFYAASRSKRLISRLVALLADKT